MTNPPTRALLFKGSSTVSSWKEVAIVGLLLVYSGNLTPGRIFPIEPQLVCLALLFGLLLLRQKRHVVTPFFAGVTLVYAVILIIQCIDFSFYPLITMARFFVRLFIGYAAFQIVKDFPWVYIRVMIFLAILSLCFHVPTLLLLAVGIDPVPLLTHIGNLIGTTGQSKIPLLVHTFTTIYMHRNGGMFWEPGAFQGYLILALIFLALIRNRLSPKQYRWSFIILTMALVTTLSTTGYIVYALVLVLHYKWRTHARFKVDLRIFIGLTLLLPVFIGISYVAYKNLSFLGEKIENEFSQLEEQKEGWHRGRIGSLVFDWDYIKRRPLFGWGLHPKTRYALHPWVEDSEGMGNGFSDFTAKFGVLGILTWLFAAFCAFRRLSGGNTFQATFISIILILELQGECFLGCPLFLGLAFLRTPVYVSRISRSVPAYHKKRKLFDFLLPVNKGRDKRAICEFIIMDPKF